MVFGIPLVLLILSVGVYFTFKTKGFQIKYFPYILKNTLFSVFKKEQRKGVSSFAALTTTLAATIGTGNIIGVSAALIIGGPGAVFWMWVSAFFGMMTNYAETEMSILYRKKDEQGNFYGGAMYYLKNCFSSVKGKKVGAFLAAFFSFFCVMSSFCMGNLTQSGSLISAAKLLGANEYLTGLIVSAFIFFTSVGGITRVSKLTTVVVPFMAICYIFISFCFFTVNFNDMPNIFLKIIKNAFGFSAINGGFSGAVLKVALLTGFKRGVFSNEAGIGSTTIASAAANVKSAGVQGMWGIFQVFFDTIVICSLTAFMILCSGRSLISADNVVDISNGAKTIKLTEDSHIISDYPLNKIKIINVKCNDKFYSIEIENKNNYLNVVQINKAVLNGKEQVFAKSLNSVEVVSFCFYEQFGTFGSFILQLMIILFAATTLIGWSYQGAEACRYLFGKKSIFSYKIIFAAFAFLGCLLDLGSVFILSDIFNGLMAIPNLIGIIVLSKKVIRINYNYIKSLYRY